MSKEISFLTETQCINCRKNIDSNIIIVADSEEEMNMIYQMMIKHVREACDECLPKLKKVVKANEESSDQFIFLGDE
ncbi:MAG: hypothetical protein V3U54_13355 [Thermodesulfobacteriota bacterium]